MLTQIILFVIILSGSIWGSAVCKKKFEQMLPITCSGIVIILFICGILNQLKQGVCLVLVVCGILWIYSIFVLLRGKKWKEFVCNFITPAFLIFSVGYIVLTYVDYGMMAATWDEFSHWADIVKAMVAIDDFGTNPLAQSMFQSYPPGMSLFQYFVQKVFLLLNSKEVFSEWHLYFSYQILFLSFLMPFLKKLEFGNFSIINLYNMVVVAILCCLGPMIIFHDIYIIILIDGFLGILAGTGIAMIFITEDKDWTFDAYIISNISLLVLVKDAGMLFAVFLFFAYVLDIIFYRNEKHSKRIFLFLSGASAVLLPKILWSYDIKINNATVAFSNKVDIGAFLRVVLGIDNTTYRTEVIKNYANAFLSRYFVIGDTPVKLSYFCVFVLLMCTCHFVGKQYKKRNIGNCEKQKIILFMMLFECVVYFGGLCITYMFKFSEYEAVRLASYERYMNIILQASVTFLLMIVANYIISAETRHFFGICVLSLVLLVLPWDMIDDVKDRQTVLNTVNTRIRYMPLIEKIERIAEETGEIYNICVISQESAGYDKLILRYSLRPHNIVGAESIGIPFYEGDIWTVEKTVDDWKEELRCGTDYVALYHLNDYFVKEFSGVFQKPESIRENEVYEVDKTTGLLILYEN